MSAQPLLNHESTNRYSASTSTMPLSSTNSMLSIIKKFFHAVLLIILTPFIICILLVILLVWALLTLSGIGPILHYYYSCCDLRLLSRDKLLKDHPELILVSIPADINKASNGKSYSIVARWVKSPTPSIYPPIILPNGLAATSSTAGDATRFRLQFSYL
jgi:hypothetical protein